MKKILAVLILMLMPVVAFAGINVSSDVNRDTIVAYASFTSTTTVETTVTFNVSENATTATSGTSWTVPTKYNGFKMQALTASCKALGGTPAASAATLKMYVNSIQQGMPYQVACPTTVAASAAAFPSIPVIFPDGLMLKPGSVISFTLTLTVWTASDNTPVLNLGWFGYEY